MAEEKSFVVTVFLDAICLLAGAFLIYVVLQFRRELNGSNSPKSSNQCTDDFDSAGWRLRHIWADRMARCGDRPAKLSSFRTPAGIVPKKNSSAGGEKQERNRKPDLIRTSGSSRMDLERPRGVRHTRLHLASPRGLLSYASLGFVEEVGHAVEPGNDRGSKKGKS
jgi:hypothetical protein